MGVIRTGLMSIPIQFGAHAKDIVSALRPPNSSYNNQ